VVKGVKERFFTAFRMTRLRFNSLKRGKGSKREILHCVQNDKTAVQQPEERYRE